MVTNENASAKCKLAVCILCNPMGFHRFYLGIKGGILMLVLSLLIVTLPISIIITLVDFYKILSGKMTDSEGKIITYWITNE